MMPALLADFGGFFAVLFLLISFFGWIINMINAQNPPPAPNRGPQRRPRARDRKVQNEIEQFLQEAMGNKGAARQDEVPDDQIEVVEATPPRRVAPPRRKPRPQPTTAPRATVRAAVKPAVPVGERPRPGSGVATGQLGPRSVPRSELVAQEPGPKLATSISQAPHLGELAAATRAPRGAARPVTQPTASVPAAAGWCCDTPRPTDRPGASQSR